MFKKHFPLFNEAGAGGDPGSGAPTPTPAPTPAATPAPTPAPSPSGSALSTGADPAAEWPEKFRTTGEDGAFDLNATAAKTRDAYTALEKRFGTGDIPPKAPEEYKLSGLPETVSVDELRADPHMQTFLKGAHAKGMTDAQVSYTISEHLRILREGGHPALMNADQAHEELSKLWSDDATYTKNIQGAFRAADHLAKKAGFSMAEVEASTLGNHPLFLRMMSALGGEIGEDTSTGASSQTAQQQQDVETLMRGEAYQNPRHADHAVTVAKVRAHFEAKYGKTPVA